MRHNKLYQNMQFPAWAVFKGVRVYPRSPRTLTKYATRLEHGQKLLKGKKAII